MTYSNVISSLSPDLRPIYDLEIALGNNVARVEAPAGSTCQLAVVFQDALHVDTIGSSITLSPTVCYWESRDPHYPVQAGYVCKTTGHAIAGPLR